MREKVGKKFTETESSLSTKDKFCHPQLDFEFGHSIPKSIKRKVNKSDKNLGTCLLEKRPFKWNTSYKD